jgi:hypothetical protein
MCKEIPVNRVVDPKRTIEKNGGPRRRRRNSGLCVHATFVTRLLAAETSGETAAGPTSLPTWPFPSSPTVRHSTFRPRSKRPLTTGERYRQTDRQTDRQTERCEIETDVEV